MGRILVGTSGYSYDDWRGLLYPDSLGKEDFLEYYALRFPFVELNFSYYAMPNARSLSNMASRTPPGFLFTIKAHKSLPPAIGPDWPKDAAAFSDAVSALASSGKLAGILVQLPFRFHYTNENRIYLGKLLERLKAFPLFVEFRNDEWQGERTRDALCKGGVGLVLVDKPDLAGLPPDMEAVCGKHAYIRFHGRNEDAWWSGDNVTRYDYPYTSGELEPWAGRLKRLSGKAELVLVAFNNHSKGRAVTNAESLTAMIVQ